MNSKERHEARYQRRKARRESINKERAEQVKWEDVFGLLPLCKGYKTCAKASKNRNQTQIWMSNLVTNARKEQKRLEEGRWKSRGFHNFVIKERGKWRNIQSVHISEKGIQSSLSNNYLIPILTPHLIYDNGASLKGKGTDFSLKRLEKHLRDHIRQYGTTGGIYFFDFKGYFSTIPHERLIEKVGNLAGDEAITETYRVFVDAFGGSGLGLGSQISQISAVFYPNSADHLIKDRFGVKGYARHMDDGYIIHQDIEELKKISKIFEEHCESIGLTMNRKKCQIIKIDKPFRFLKVRFFISGERIIKRQSRETAKRERQRLKAYAEFCKMGLMTQKEAYLNFHSWILAQKGRCYHMKLNMIRYYNSLFIEPYEPPKIKTRKQKVLKHIALEARK